MIQEKTASFLSSRHSKLVTRGLLFLVLFLVGTARLSPTYNAGAKFPLHPEAIHLARSLAFHHQFADPFRLASTGPSAYLSPAFPAFLALLIRLFGTGPQADFAFRFAAAAATAAQLALLPLLTEFVGLRLGAGLLAWFMGILPPILTFPEWEMAYAGLLAVIATILFWVVLTHPKARFGWSASLGAISGLLLLTSASALPVLLAWFGYSIWKFRTRVFHSGRWAAMVVLILVLIPWTARNYLVFHRWIPLRSALGLALEASNNDCALAGVRQSEASGCFFLHSPNHNPAEADRARTLGESEYNAMKLRDTIAWITNHPRRFAVLTAQRFYAFWFPNEGESLREEFTRRARRRERLAIYLATILSVPGLLAILKAKREVGGILASWLVFFPPIYYIALFEDRYRYPILWVTFVCAGYSLAYFATAVVRRLIAQPISCCVGSS